jgi:hypothetical protein
MVFFENFVSSLFFILSFLILPSITLIIGYFFCFYWPTKYYINKIVSLLFLFIGLYLLLYLHFQEILFFTNILLSIGLFVGILGLLIIGILIGMTMMFFVFPFEVYKKLHDSGLLDGIKSLKADFQYKAKNKRLVEENNKKICEGTHSAAILAIKKGTFFNDESVFAEGVDLLTEYFKKQDLPFYIYICKTPDEAKQVINDKNVEKIWIFGHGAMYGLWFGKNGLLNYRDLKNAPKKDFIGQFHCNAHSECGSSLADLILKSDGKKFVKEGYRSLHQNRLAIIEGNKKDWICELADPSSL